MIKSVTITNYLGEKLKINLSEAEPETGILIKKIEGLGPVKANVNQTELATRDGSIHNFTRALNRNIVMTLLFEGARIEDVRLLTYKYFPIKQPIMFRIETDNRIAETMGRVEENDPEIFSQREETQISIVCEDSYFYDANDESCGYNTVNFFGAEPKFEFPFSNESITEKLIEFGSIEVRSERSIIYEGDAQVGIIMRLKASGPVNDITIYRLDTRERIYVYTSRIEALTGLPFDSGDEIIISTIKGNKYARLLRNGIVYNVLNALNRYPDWFELSKGDNVFSFTSEGTISNLRVSFEYRTIYEGV